MANPSELQQRKETPDHRNTFTERSHGVVVPHAFPHASSICQPCTIQGLVFKPPDQHGGRLWDCEQGKQKPQPSSFSVLHRFCIKLYRMQKLEADLLTNEKSRFKGFPFITAVFNTNWPLSIDLQQEHCASLIRIFRAFATYILHARIFTWVSHIVGDISERLLPLEPFSTIGMLTQVFTHDLTYVTTYTGLQRNMMKALTLSIWTKWCDPYPERLPIQGMLLLTYLHH